MAKKMVSSLNNITLSSFFKEGLYLNLYYMKSPTWILYSVHTYILTQFKKKESYLFYFIYFCFEIFFLLSSSAYGTYVNNNNKQFGSITPKISFKGSSKMLFLSFKLFHKIKHWVFFWINKWYTYKKYLLLSKNMTNFMILTEIMPQK